jgi:hypothetical protein
VLNTLHLVNEGKALRKAGGKDVFHHQSLQPQAEMPIIQPRALSVALSQNNGAPFFLFSSLYRLSFRDLFSFRSIFFSLAMLGFELRASHLLGRHCYVLSYSVSSFL